MRYLTRPGEALRSDHGPRRSAASGGHAASAQGELFYALRRWQAATGDGGLLLQDVFVSFHGGQYISPDIAWWSAVRRPALRDGAFDVIPDLVGTFPCG